MSADPRGPIVFDTTARRLEHQFPSLTREVTKRAAKISGPVRVSVWVEAVEGEE